MCKYKQKENCKMTYEFTHGWFYHSDLYNFRLLDRCFPDDAPVKILEIGSYEGLSSTYFADNFLWQHEGSRLTCVDPFSTADTTAPVTDATERVFLSNVARCRCPEKVLHVKMFSRDFFASNHETSFDFIYIDGSHLVEDLVFDMEESYKVIKPGGYILIDDYRWNGDVLKPCIDEFVRNHSDLEVLSVYYQMFLRKRTLA